MGKAGQLVKAQERGIALDGVHRAEDIVEQLQVFSTGHHIAWSAQGNTFGLYGDRCIAWVRVCNELANGI